MTNVQDLDEFKSSLAERYRGEGYDVILEPKRNQRPDFLRDFEPDMIATRADSNVIVEIKIAGSKFGNREVEEISSRVEALPNWRVDLAYFDPVSQNGLGNTVRRLSSPNKIKNTLHEAEELFASGASAASFLLAWSAFEGAAIRALRKKEEEDVSRSLSSNDVIKRLVFNGLLSDEDFIQMREIYELRNRLAHGMLSEQVSRVRFRILVETAENLLDNKFVEAA